MTPRDRLFLDRAFAVSPVFAAVSAEARKDLHLAARRIDFHRRTLLCVAKEVPDYLYLVRKGRIELVATSSGGDETTLAALGEGAWATWLGAVDNSPLGHEICGIAGGAALALPVIAVRRVLAAHPHTYLAVIGEVSYRFRAALRFIGHSASHDRPQRLARLLLTLAQTSGDPREIAMTQGKLARLLGCSRQTLAGSLLALENRGLVSRGYRSVELLDPAALEVFAED